MNIRRDSDLYIVSSGHLMADSASYAHEIIVTRKYRSVTRTLTPVHVRKTDVSGTIPLRAPGGITEANEQT